MAKKQTIIHLHGNSQLTTNVNGEGKWLENGEIAIYNSQDAKDVEIYATSQEGDLAVFQTADKTKEQIASARTIFQGEDNFLTITSGVDETTSAITYTLETNDIASNSALTAHTSQVATSAESTESKHVYQIKSGDLKDVAYADGVAAAASHTHSQYSETTHDHGNLILGNELSGSVAISSGTGAMTLNAEVVGKLSNGTAITSGATGLTQGKAVYEFVDSAKTELRGEISSANSDLSALSGVVGQHSTDISDLKNDKLNKSDFDTYSADTKTAVTKEIATAISNVVSGAPEAFDTLKEIADWIQNDEGNTVADIIGRIASIEDVTNGYSGEGAIKAHVDQKLDNSTFNAYTASTETATSEAIAKAKTTLETGITNGVEVALSSSDPNKYTVKGTGAIATQYKYYSDAAGAEKTDAVSNNVIDLTNIVIYGGTY